VLRTLNSPAEKGNKQNSKLKEVPLMHKKEEEKQKIVVFVSMNNSQKIVMRRMTSNWGIGMSAVLRRLISYVVYRVFTKRNLTLENLLKEYQKSCTDNNFSGNFSARNDKKTYKVSVRLSEKDYHELNTLAEQGFYLPGELLSILVELLSAGIIAKHDIWNYDCQVGSV
jgi:hypothetical protein